MSGHFWPHIRHRGHSGHVEAGSAGDELVTVEGFACLALASGAPRAAATLDGNRESVHDLIVRGASVSRARTRERTRHDSHRRAASLTLSRASSCPFATFLR